jgi:hypothetical protein
MLAGGASMSYFGDRWKLHLSFHFSGNPSKFSNKVFIPVFANTAAASSVY